MISPRKDFIHHDRTIARSACPTAVSGDSAWPAAAGVAAADFRAAMGCFASGVTVVTAGTEAGEVAGLTANAFTSVSLDPPLILVCIKQESHSIEVLRRAGRFAVHVLRSDQAEAAQAFARPAGDKLGAMALTWSRHDIPVMESCLVRLECALAAEYEGGDHGIFLGRVLALDMAPAPHAPLTYFRGKLGALKLAES